MTLDELIAEGESISRPSFILRPEPSVSGIVAYWGGERRDIPNVLPREVTAFTERRHILTLSEALFSHLKITRGPSSLFEWSYTKGGQCYTVEPDSRIQFRELAFSGEPLYATPEPSFPPFAAVCLYGSDRVGAWLREQGFNRHEYWCVTGELEMEYTLEWQRRSPFFQNAGDVVVGGWHIQWDDFYMPPERQLVALTLREAEPWFEIWYSRPTMGFRVEERIT